MATSGDFYLAIDHLPDLTRDVSGAIRWRYEWIRSLM